MMQSNYLFSLALAFATTLLVSSLSMGISRVGNGASLVSHQSLFKVDVPENFRQITLVGNNGARLLAPPIMPYATIGSLTYSNTGRLFDPFSPVVIEIRDAGEEFPEIANLSEQQIYDFFVRLGYSKNELSNQKCGYVFSNSSSSLITYVVVFGEKRGYVLVSPFQAQAKEAATKIIQSTQLIDGACSWKN